MSLIIRNEKKKKSGKGKGILGYFANRGCDRILRWGAEDFEARENFLAPNPNWQIDFLGLSQPSILLFTQRDTCYKREAIPILTKRKRLDKCDRKKELRKRSGIRGKQTSKKIDLKKSLLCC